MTARVNLTEIGPPEHPVPAAVVATLVAAGVVDIAAAGDGAVTVKGKGIVGVGRVGDVEVVITPKVGISRLLFLLGYAQDPTGWRDDLVTLSPADGLVEAVARSLLAHTDRIVARGLMQGYRSTDDVLPVLRGRLREADQVRRRPGMPYPLEVTYDEWTTDVLENQLLKAAAGVLLRLPLRDDVLRSRLVRLHRGVLVDVAEMPPALLVGRWRKSRLNARYEAAVVLAELILRNRSLEAPTGATQAAGFLFVMHKVFEDFVSAALREALAPAGGDVVLQYPGHLDESEQVPMRPDIVWRRGGHPRAVVDAKYKAEKPSGYPNADVYQMLAYCTALRLAHGYLVYARGNEVPAEHRIRHADVSIHGVTLDLGRDPADLLAQVRGLAAALVQQASSAPTEAVAVLAARPA